jgi:hypothetical protein
MGLTHCLHPLTNCSAFHILPKETMVQMQSNVAVLVTSSSHDPSNKMYVNICNNKMVCVQYRYPVKLHIMNYSSTLCPCFFHVLAQINCAIDFHAYRKKYI